MMGASPVRVGDWIQTFTGKAFYPLDPWAIEVDPLDIAHSLAHQCRYAGHCLTFYSVAEHSILVSHAVPKEDALWGLLHDAAEAYLVDLPRPVKWSMPEYSVHERRLQRVIAARFGLSMIIPDAVMDIDKRILLNERDSIMSKPPFDWDVAGEPVAGVRLIGMPPRIAKDVFLNRLAELT